MNVLIKQFLGKNHSWSVVGWGIATALINQGHEVHLFSTDGVTHLPHHLLPNLIGYVEENQTQVFGRAPDREYDCQISYTALKNFPYYLANASKNRFGIWCYEWFNNEKKNVLPVGFAKHYKSCDLLCAPSDWQINVFNDCGIPRENMVKIPHGISAEQYKQTTTMVLPTKKKYKILANIAQNHMRKNIPGLLDAYGKAFTNKDDVCLILKAKEKPVKAPFEVSLNDCLKTFNQKYPKHGEIKVISSFIDDISALYRSVDATFTMTLGEGFYFPGLESIAAGKLAIAPDFGGHTDFLKNNYNSLLIEGKPERAHPKSVYWEPNPNALWYRPNMDKAVELLQYSYDNFDNMNSEIEKQRQSIYDEYDWSVIASQFIDLCK